MTYMSMPAIVKPLVAADGLHCLPSAITGFETQREIYATRPIRDAVLGPFSYDG